MSSSSAILLGGGIEATDAITWRGQSYPVERGPIVASASGNTEIVAAAANTRVLLLAYNLMGNGVVNAKWQSGATDITGRLFCVEAGRGKVVPFNPKGWAITASGEALNLNLSAAIAVEGEGVWVRVPA